MNCKRNAFLQDGRNTAICKPSDTAYNFHNGGTSHLPVISDRTIHGENEFDAPNKLPFGGKTGFSLMCKLLFYFNYILFHIVVSVKGL